MTTVAHVVEYLETLAAPALAEDWDNVGLLLGDRQSEVRSVMTCLTLTPDVATEAIQQQASLVVTHHPILFRAIKRLTTETAEGRMLIDLVRGGVSVYSPHTSFDNGKGGINQWIAEQLGLTNISPLRLRDSETRQEPTESLGSGRFGDFSAPLDWTEFHRRIQRGLKASPYQWVKPADSQVRRVGVACGAAAEFLPDAAGAGCDVLITGEARFHACLEARTMGLGLVLLGHYTSERPALEMLSERLARHFPQLTVWASQEERDPLDWVVASENP